MFELIVVLIVIFIIFGIATMLVIKNLLYVGRPDEVLIFAGVNQQRGKDGKTVGYRSIIGGRTIKKPFLEKVAKLDLSNMNINVQVENAFSKGGIPVCVQGVANLKIASEEPFLGNAIERFLKRSRKDIMKIAKETLEGNLRGVLATLTPEQVNEDKIAFAQNLIEEAEHDLYKIGLKLDSLKIQNVWDNMKYLDSLGRVRNAVVRKEARIAEADARSKAKIRASENKLQTELQKIKSIERELKAGVERKLADLNSKKEALIAQQVGEVNADIARVNAEIKVQQARIEQVKRKLEADIVAPARAHRDENFARAKGAGAKILQEGKATAEALQQMIDVWKKAGSSAKDVFLMQKLENLTQMIVSSIQDIQVNRLVLLQTGEGANTAKQLISAAEQLKATLGVDLTEFFNKKTKQKQSSPVKQQYVVKPSQKTIKTQRLSTTLTPPPIKKKKN